MRLRITICRLGAGVSAKETIIAIDRAGAGRLTRPMRRGSTRSALTTRACREDHAPMKLAVAAALSTALVLGSGAVARADCGSVPGCLLHLGVGRLDPKLNAIVGATAAAVIAGGLELANAQLRVEPPLPVGVLVSTDENGREHLELELIPVPPPLQLVPTSLPVRDETVRVYDGRLRMSDTVANVALAVGGAALLTSIIVGMIRK
jgi:hypothetical protein